jgi:hypothetical protein
MTTRRQQALHAKQAAEAAGGGAAAAAPAARSGAPAAPQKQQQPAGPPPTALDYARFAVLQHGGLGLCAAGLALLCCGYGADWMHPTHLSLLSLVLCLLGLAMHETRPYKVCSRAPAALAPGGAPRDRGAARRRAGLRAARPASQRAPPPRACPPHTAPPVLPRPSAPPSQRDEEFKQQMAARAGAKQD